MRVLVTGGTGFVGSHTVAAVLAAGHDVRLLVRRPERVAAALEPLGVTVRDTVTGDVLDAPSVRAALDGCEAVIHAAAVFSLDPRREDSVLSTNVRAAENVLGAACAAGLDPVVHVSSVVALMPHRGVLDPDAPVGRGGPAYPRSKAASEEVARRLQSRGAPLVITYPGSVAGPHDPYLGETNFGLAMILRDLIPFDPPGGWPVADVRYVARAHAAALEPGRGPRRHLLCGHYRSLHDIRAVLRRLTGRRLPAVPVPGGLARLAGRGLDAVRPLLPGQAPFGHQAAWIITGCPRTDDSRTRDELGVEPPPLEATLTDTVLWLVEAGHISPGRAGRLLRGGASTG